MTRLLVLVELADQENIPLTDDNAFHAVQGHTPHNHPLQAACSVTRENGRVTQVVRAAQIALRDHGEAQVTRIANRVLQGTFPRPQGRLTVRGAQKGLGPRVLVPLYARSVRQPLPRRAKLQAALHSVSVMTILFGTACQAMHPKRSRPVKQKNSIHSWDWLVRLVSRIMPV